MRGPPDNGRGRAPDELPGLKTQTNTATNGSPIIADQADPRRIGELLGDWLAIRMDEVDALIDEARDRAEAIPDRRSLMLLIGELTVRLHCVELAIDELKAAKR